MEFLFIFLIVLNVFLGAAYIMALYARRMERPNLLHVDHLDEIAAKRMGVSVSEIKRAREERLEAARNSQSFH